MRFGMSKIGPWSLLDPIAQSGDIGFTHDGKEFCVKEASRRH